MRTTKRAEIHQAGNMIYAIQRVKHIGLPLYQLTDSTGRRHLLGRYNECMDHLHALKLSTAKSAWEGGPVHSYDATSSIIQTEREEKWTSR